MNPFACYLVKNPTFALPRWAILRLFAVWFSSLAISYATPAFGQSVRVAQMRFERVAESEGLNSNTVRSLYQDSKGFIWAATESAIDADSLTVNP
jgi:hypothetical protein